MLIGECANFLGLGRNVDFLGHGESVGLVNRSSISFLVFI